MAAARATARDALRAMNQRAFALRRGPEIRQRLKPGAQSAKFIKAGRRQSALADIADHALGVTAGEAKRVAAVEPDGGDLLMLRHLTPTALAVGIDWCATRGIERDRLRRARTATGHGVVQNARCGGWVRSFACSLAVEAP